MTNTTLQVGLEHETTCTGVQRVYDCATLARFHSICQRKVKFAIVRNSLDRAFKGVSHDVTRFILTQKDDTGNDKRLYFLRLINRTYREYKYILQKYHIYKIYFYQYSMIPHESYDISEK